MSYLIVLGYLFLIMNNWLAGMKVSCVIEWNKYTIIITEFCSTQVFTFNLTVSCSTYICNNFANLLIFFYNTFLVNILRRNPLGN